MRSRIGFLLDVAACSRAVILKSSHGSTRGSFAPVIKQHGRIGGAVLDVLIGVHRVQRLEAVGVLDRAEFGRVHRAVRSGFPAQRVHHADVARWQSAKRSGRCVSAPPIVIPPALVPRPASFARRSVALLDQVLGAGDEVADRILLGQLLTGQVPVLAVFAAAAQVRLGDDDPLLQQRQVASRRSKDRC